jgi:SAM-dependent methyltransferase
MNKEAYREHYLVEKNHWWFVVKRNFINSILEPLQLTKAKILDIGCGTGATTKFLTRWGDVSGIDTSREAISFAKKNEVSAVLGKAECLPFPDNTFNLVTLLDVLYHQKIDIKSTLNETFRVLKPGGFLLITDCALQQFWSSHDEVMHARERFNKKRLQALVVDSGFTVHRSSYLYCYTFPLFIVSRLLFKDKDVRGTLKLPPSFINKVLINLLRLEARQLQISNLPIGSSIGILAQKL